MSQLAELIKTGIGIKASEQVFTTTLQIQT